MKPASSIRHLQVILSYKAYIGSEVVFLPIVLARCLDNTLASLANWSCLRFLYSDEMGTHNLTVWADRFEAEMSNAELKPVNLLPRRRTISPYLRQLQRQVELVSTRSRDGPDPFVSAIQSTQQRHILM